MANAFLSGYNKRKYRGFVANDAVKANWAKLIVGYAGAGSDADAKVYNLTCRSDFNDYALARFAAGANTRQKEWKEKHTADTSADKWFKPTESYSSVLTANAASGQKVVNINDASGVVAGDWLVITRDSGVDEFLQIASKATNALTMETNLANAYTTADNAKVMLGYYIYYDDSDDATDYQDGANTFVFFDNYSGDLSAYTQDPVSKWSISNGRLLPVNEDGIIIYKTADLTPTDYAVRATLNFTSTATFGAVLGRFADSTHFYSLNISENHDRMDLHLQDAGWILLDREDPVTINAATDYVLELRMDGDSIKGFLDGVEKVSATNSVITAAGTVGARSGNVTANIYYDNLIARNYPDIAGAGFGAEEEHFEKTLTELLGLSDTVVKNPSLLKTELLGLLDIYDRTWIAHKGLTELLGLSDTIVKAPALVKTELLGLSDTVVKNPSLLKTELLGLLDIYDRTWIAHKGLTELLGLADTLSKGITQHPLTESLGLLDSVTKTPSITRIELLGLKDLITKDTSITRTELLGLLDSISKDIAQHPLTELLGLLDGITKASSITRIESLGLTDRVSKHVSLHALTEILGLLDSISYGKNLTVLAKLIRKYIQLTNIGGRN